MPTAVSGRGDAVLSDLQIHVWTAGEAVDETRCYDVTKPESFVIEVFGCTLILLTWIQAFYLSQTKGQQWPSGRFFVSVWMVWLFQP